MRAAEDKTVQQPQKCVASHAGLPPSAVPQIAMPRVDTRENVTFFAIDVMPGSSVGNAPWRVTRRYDDFHGLLETLGLELKTFPEAPFPRKTGFVLAEEMP